MEKKSFNMFDQLIHFARSEILFICSRKNKYVNMGNKNIELIGEYMTAKIPKRGPAVLTILGRSNIPPIMESGMKQCIMFFMEKHGDSVRKEPATCSFVENASSTDILRNIGAIKEHGSNSRPFQVKNMHAIQKEHLPKTLKR